MGKYILRRCIYALLTLWVIASITFVLMKILPGDPFNDPKLKPEVKANLIRQYGLDKSISQQYALYMKNLMRGDLGTSLKYPGRSVTKMISESFPKSYALGWRAMVIAVSFGLTFGIVAALNHQRLFDYFTIFLAIMGVSVPMVVMGPVLVYTFGVNLGWLPVTVDARQISYLLPSFTLALGSLAFISRLMRTTTLEVLNQDYIITAKSKGLTSKKIIWSHVIRNAIMPVVTVLGPLFAALITGSIVIEKIFAVAGLGEYFVKTIFEADYPMIMGITIFYAALIIMSILVIDVVYGLIDPKLRIAGRSEK